MLTRMQLSRITPLLLFLASLAAVPLAHARGTIEKVQIKGLDKGDDAEIIENIEVSLSLYDAVGKVQGESRLEYLLSQAEAQTRQALEPFGFYNPKISVEAPRNGETLQVLIQVVACLVRALFIDDQHFASRRIRRANAVDQHPLE